MTLAQGYEMFTAAIPPSAVLAEAENSPSARDVIADIAMFHGGEPQAARAIDAAGDPREHGGRPAPAAADAVSPA